MIKKKYLNRPIIIALLLMNGLIVLTYIVGVYTLKFESETDYGRYVISQHRLIDTYTGIQVDPYVFSSVQQDGHVYMYGVTGYYMIDSPHWPWCIKKYEGVSDETDQSMHVRVIYYTDMNVFPLSLSVQRMGTVTRLNPAIIKRLDVTGLSNKMKFLETVKNNSNKDLLEDTSYDDT